MATKNFFIADGASVAGQDDILPCMVSHYRDWTKLKENSFKAEETTRQVLLKCNCADPATEHAGTYLEGATVYTQEEIDAEMVESDWIGE